jgi:SAM-dependent methyltransferase
MNGDTAWLKQNADLRVDPNVPIFADSRARFAQERYRFAAADSAGKRVLDAACGTGFGSAMLSERSRGVVGVDHCEEAVSYAARHFGSARATFRKSCVEALPFEENSFDLVVSFETLEHLVAPRACLAEFARVLDPEGTAIFSIPNGWGLTAHHFIDFNFELLRELTSGFFVNCEYFYHNSGDKADKTLVGIGPLGEISAERAECVLAVCQGPRKDHLPRDPASALLDEIYRNAFQRHHEYLHVRERSVAPLSPNEGRSHSSTAVRAGETLTLQANDFGEACGMVQLQVPIEVLKWHPHEVTVRMPHFSGPTTSLGQLNIVLADGRVAASPCIRLVPRVE